ncbi:MAG: hypothetical protein FRX48_03860 [Lasallia pustulata]|uniref:Uncharacterized protein n=1 Tax=Lasallia pustulata TaxID=136370 RepID=A0A5M8PV15_9LECA|nr:MAG: hypothetical protein FRX48_03860 [Lasallia pustulata]
MRCAVRQRSDKTTMCTSGIIRRYPITGHSPYQGNSHIPQPHLPILTSILEHSRALHLTNQPNPTDNASTTSSLPHPLNATIPTTSTKPSVFPPPQGLFPNQTKPHPTPSTPPPQRYLPHPIPPPI